MQYLGDLDSDVLYTRIVGGVVADEPQDIHRLLTCIFDAEAQLLGPFWTLAGWLAQGVAGALNCREGILQRPRHATLFDEQQGKRDPGRLRDAGLAALRSNAA